MNQLWIDFLITAGVCSAVLAIRILIKKLCRGTVSQNIHKKQPHRKY